MMRKDTPSTQTTTREWISFSSRSRTSQRAGVRRIVLHEGRHTALSLMEKAGVPISVISRWAGHYDSAFTYRQYVHADHAEDMRQGATTLGQLYTINPPVREIGGMP